MQRNWTEELAKLKTFENLREIAEKLESSPEGLNLINVQIIPIITGYNGVKNYKILGLSDEKTPTALGKPFKENPDITTLKLMADLGAKSILSKISLYSEDLKTKVIFTWILESNVSVREYYTAIWECVTKMKVFGEPESILFGTTLVKKKRSEELYMGQINRRMIRSDSTITSKWERDMASLFISGENWFLTGFGEGVASGKLVRDLIKNNHNWNSMVGGQTPIIDFKCIIINEKSMDNLCSKYDYKRAAHPFRPVWVSDAHATLVDENATIYPMSIDWTLYQPAEPALKLLSELSEFK